MSKNLSKVAINVIIITIVTKVWGALRDLVLSFCFGSSSISDAYILATTIPVTIFAFIYEGIGASYIPACSRTKDKDEENKLTNNLINILCIMTFITIMLIEIFPTFFIKIFASGYSGEILEQTIFIFRISVIGVFFSSAVYVFVYYLNKNNSFIIPAVRSIPMDIIVIISILVSSYSNSLIPMAMGIPISLLAELIFLLPYLRKKGYRYKLNINFRDENIKNIIKWSIPVIIATAINDLNTIVDRQFSSWLMAGGISALTYSSRTLNVVRTALFIPIITVLFPKFSCELNNGNKEYVSKISSEALSILILISIPISFGTILLSNNIIKILFERGAFDANSTLITGNCLKLYAISLIGYATMAVTTKLYHASTNMRTPMIISVIGILLNICFNYCFIKTMGLSGLALGTSLSTIIMAILQYIFLNRKINFDNKHIIKTILKSLIASIIMFLTILIVYKYLENKLQYIPLTIFIVMIGFSIYVCLLYIFRVEEFSELKRILKRE